MDKEKICGTCKNRMVEDGTGRDKCKFGWMIELHHAACGKYTEDKKAKKGE